MSLINRVLLEKRAVLIPLAVAAAANVAGYVLVVRPLEIKSTTAVERAAAATGAVRAAEREHAAAEALVTGKTKADEELSTFYQKVVPSDLAAARQMTYAALPALARKSNVKYEQRRFEVDSSVKGGRLGHLRIRMVLQGDYENLRRFIYALETAPQFVIIDELSLAQNDPAKPLTLTLALSTYYRLGANAT
jgi:hypothetical protein